jgi:LacI family transcriptional regulator
MENLKDRVTIYQVAQAAGVSLATVSRVINKQGNVTEATRKKVEDTIKELGYKPSGLAQALATNRTTNIGVIIPSANYVYISNMLNGITDVAKEKGFVLTLFSTSHSRDEALSMIEKVITAHVDGVIIFDDELDASDVMKINSYNVPSIVVNNKVTGDKVGCILFNYDDLLREAIENYYNEKHGDKVMTFLHVHNCGRLLARCEKTFVETHEKLGKKYNVINCDDSYSRTYSDFTEYFQKNKTGYFIAYRDSIAAAVENAATDSGLKIPEEVEVVSLVGTKYANIVRPSLTSMQIDMAEVGKRAMYMLIDLLNHDLIEKTAKFDAHIVIRNSTKV